MIESGRLKSLSLADCQLGDLVVANPHSPSPMIGLVAEAAGHRGIVWFGPPKERGFNFVPTDGGDTKYLIVRDWHLEVDMDSISSPFRSDYTRGHVALEGEEFYFICTYGMHSQFFSVKGAPMQKEHGDFTFGQWRIVVKWDDEEFQFWPLMSED